MSAITTVQTVRDRTAGPLEFLRKRVGSWGLILALLALPIYYTLHDLISGYQVGLTASGHPIIHHDLSLIGFNLVEGLSNGSIWALIAIGYTLVYGIIELINFAHGDVFMIGSFTAAAVWATLGLTLATGPLGVDLRSGADADHHDARHRVAQRADRARRLQAAAQRAQARAADHGDRLLVRAAERRPAVAGRQPGRVSPT